MASDATEKPTAATAEPPRGFRVYYVSERLLLDVLNNGLSRFLTLTGHEGGLPADAHVDTVWAEPLRRALGIRVTSQEFAPTEPGYLCETVDGLLLSRCIPLPAPPAELLGTRPDDCSPEKCAGCGKC